MIPVCLFSDQTCIKLKNDEIIKLAQYYTFNSLTKYAFILFEIFLIIFLLINY